MFITEITALNNNHWLVVYYEPMTCMCGNIRKTIVIESLEKPKEDEIKNQIERVRATLGSRGD